MLFRSAEIDRLTAMTKEPTKLMVIPALMEASGWVRKKEWVGLTDEEINKWNIMEHESLIEFVRAIEAKLKEKNT